MTIFIIVDIKRFLKGGSLPQSPRGAFLFLRLFFLCSLFSLLTFFAVRRGERDVSSRGSFFKCAVNVIKSSYFFRLKYHSRTVLKPGEGARALRFHDLSRRGSRVVGRSDAVLHRFGEAKPSRNGCIVVRPLPHKLGCIPVSYTHLTLPTNREV